MALNDLGAAFENDDPPLAVLVPVKTYKEFRETFLTAEELKTLDRGPDGVDAIKTAAFGEEKPAYLVDLKDYVAITVDKATADVYAGKYARASAEQMGAELSESFLKADVGLYINMDAINDQFGEQIRGIQGARRFRNPAGRAARDSSRLFHEANGRAEDPSQGRVPGRGGLPFRGVRR